jgi:hypothetical protein
VEHTDSDSAVWMAWAIRGPGRCWGQRRDCSSKGWKETNSDLGFSASRALWGRDDAGIPENCPVSESISLFQSLLAGSGGGQMVLSPVRRRGDGVQRC